MICLSKRAPVMKSAASKVMVRDIPVPPSGYGGSWVTA
jgi:hypothetical protein